RQSQAVRDDQLRAYVFARRGTLLRTASPLTSGNAHRGSPRATPTAAHLGQRPPRLTSGNAHRAEDLVQTVLLRLYLSWNTIRAETAGRLRAQGAGQRAPRRGTPTVPQEGTLARGHPDGRTKANSSTVSSSSGCPRA